MGHAAAMDDPAHPFAGPEQWRSRRHVNLQKILVPVDFTTSTLKALEYARALAASFESAICLLHVVEPTSLMAGVEDVPLWRSQEQIAAEIKTQMRQLAERCLPASVPVEIQVDSGMVGLSIVRAAVNLKSDLAIVTTRELHGLRRLLSRNAAEWVMRDAPCPVLLLHCAKPVALDLEDDERAIDSTGGATPTSAA